MPLFMEVHTINGGVCIEDVAKAHVADLQIQAGQDVRTSGTGSTSEAGRSSAWSRRPPLRLPPPCTARRTVWWPTRSTR
jgi:hypothetical protein